jgi:hypothetical protein
MFIPNPDLDFFTHPGSRGLKRHLPDPGSGSATLSYYFSYGFSYTYVLFSDVQDLREMFEPFGTVMEADVISGKNYGFVHIDASIGKAKISQIVRLVPTS